MRFPEGLEAVKIGTKYDRERREGCLCFLTKKYLKVSL